ncbi:bifunctional riboflavin kinase/FAD synthetase [Anaerosalibacter sp. Marseille-P3206]|uniref:bifunctional riboflavin kinase/FAD synthetase n=1 Tax=Anaerosalibacter sp. Marseille-P3206 TaxID=1871005 RepID=UPI00135669EA|nr:bifunctional riboflavin kinase/FAD synthetase [Anaerosalibacter sp. Marseille-P3206]
MNILTHESKEKVEHRTAVALGNFDGIHLGHQQLINIMTSESEKKGLMSSVLLFNNHTKSIISKESKPGILTSNEQKYRILESLGVQLIYTMKFNESIMKLSPEEFAMEILVEKMKANLVVVGFDYKFGYKAKGDAKYLRKLGIKYGFDVIVVDPVYDNDYIISSTFIRKLLKSGNIKEANKLLGRPYTIEGRVIGGKKRGRQMGFPTANLELLQNYLIPKFGVYKSKTIIDDIEYNSLTNIGKNPTFNNNMWSIESHILDFNKDIYGNRIYIKFLEYLREDKKFNTKEELINQMNLDIESIKSNDDIYNSTCL